MTTLRRPRTTLLALALLGLALWTGLVQVRVLSTGNTEEGTAGRCIAEALPEARNSMAALVLSRACRAWEEDAESPYAACVMEAAGTLSSSADAVRLDRRCREAA